MGTARQSKAPPGTCVYRLHYCYPKIRESEPAWPYTLSLCVPLTAQDRVVFDYITSYKWTDNLTYVRRVTRLHGRFFSPLYFQEYPFDSQRLFAFMEVQSADVVNVVSYKISEYGRTQNVFKLLGNPLSAYTTPTIPSSDHRRTKAPNPNPFI